MADVAVVTASFGGHDLSRGAVEQTVDAEWFAFTDDVRSVEAPYPEPWNSVGVVSHDPPANPRMTAKVYKMTPWDVLPAAVSWARERDYRYIVWLDGSMEVISSRFLEEALTSLGVVTDGHYSVAPLATWKHPRRDCVYEELEWSFLEAPEKYEPHRKAMETQVAGYERDGFPAHAGLYGAGALVWNLEHPCARELGKAWLEETRRTSIQDQLSLPVVAWRLGVPIATFSHDQTPPRRLSERIASWTRRAIRHVAGGTENRWVRIHPHTRKD